MKSHYYKTLITLILSLLVSPCALARTMVYVSNADDGEIAVYELNLNNGELRAQQTIAAGKGVMPLTVSPDKTQLYASIQPDSYALATFSINPKNGLLHKLSQAEIQGDVCFILADTSGKNLLSSSYGGSTITVNKLNSDGEATARNAKVYPTGLNAHAVLLDASNRFLFITNLGDDQILQMHFNAETGEVTPNIPAAIKTTPGAGPRHLRFSPDNKFVYVLNEYDGTVNVYSFNKTKGTLQEKQSILMTASSFKEKPSAAEIQITPNGQYVYTSERRTNTLSLFRRNAKTGLLSYVESIATENKPRSFAISPNGRYLLAAGQKSSHISVYEIEKSTGHLDFIERYKVGNNPSWVEIIDIE